MYPFCCSWKRTPGFIIVVGLSVSKRTGYGSVTVILTVDGDRHLQISQYARAMGHHMSRSATMSEPNTVMANHELETYAAWSSSYSISPIVHFLYKRGQGTPTELATPCADAGSG